MSVTINGSTGKITESEGSLKIGTNVEMTDGATLPATSLSGTVPAGSLSGATIPASQLTGVVAPANLGTGTANANTFLNGSGAYTAAGGGQLELIQKVVANNSADITITGLNAHDTYMVIGNCLDPSTSGVEDQMTMGFTDGTFFGTYFSGSQSLETDNNNTINQFQRTQGGPSFLTTRTNAMIGRSIANGQGSGVNTQVNFNYILPSHSGVSNGLIYGNFTYPKTNGALAGGMMFGVTQLIGTKVFNAIKYKFSSGNIASGSITVFAVKNS